MAPAELAADLRSRINPAYAHQIGTESYERRICAEAIEWLVAENKRLAWIVSNQSGQYQEKSHE